MVESSNTEKWYIWLITSGYKARYVLARNQRQACEYGTAMWMEKPEQITAKCRSFEIPPEEVIGVATLASDRLVRKYGDMRSFQL